MVSVGNTTFTRWSYPGSPYSARSVPPNVKRRKLGVSSVIAVTGARKKRMALAVDDTGLLGFGDQDVVAAAGEDDRGARHRVGEHEGVEVEHVADQLARHDLRRRAARDDPAVAHREQVIGVAGREVH